MKEQEALVTATIKLQFRVSGDLVKALSKTAKIVVDWCQMICPLRMWNMDWWRNEYA